MGVEMTVVSASELQFGPSSEAEGGASVPFSRIFGETDFDSHFRWLDLCIVKPGAEIGVHSHLIDDEIYIILKGNATKIVNGMEARVGPGDAVLLRCGGSHGLRNESEEEVHVLVIDLLAPPETDQRFLLRSMNDLPLVSRRSKGGAGEILVGDLFTRDELRSAWDFVQCVKLPPGSSVGVHTHSGDEELYYIFEGQGTMTESGEEFSVGPGTASLCRSGSSHGLVNTSEVDLVFLAVQAPLA
jgi:mannose-6-phosphate isomerase-like protein (cupin superfamily)